ncbi:adenine deaminase [Citrobacter amalonaticus]|uniref:adenine deaminase n=1 Tax=Citrobacter amalonaticus TaxID=35703 RepID=UPI0019054A6F|nr:adenine deaminase [Citrobacter amalonaticus]MBJ9276857.1 adenine deaminase [Citrobacter amalonaticus]MEC5721938.1 adenine deaminase [Citrobacter amalonaticus]
MNNAINHKFHYISRQEQQELLAVARGEAVADYIIDNVILLDIINGGEMTGPIVIKGRHIAGIGAEYCDAPALRRIDAHGATAVPGFIDSHLHIESSMMTPVTFETATLPRGLTTVVCDPHEIVNVMGEKGFSWFIRCAEQAKQNQYLQVSSCVPALEGCDVNGAHFSLDQMLTWRDHPLVAGLAEVMDYPGVIAGQDALLDKMDAFRPLTLDGHCPGLSGKALNAYIAAGIENCHESYTLEEGRRKLQRGMALMIREGSAARNLDALAPLINAFNSPQCLLCTDDRNPWEIAHEGHIDALIRRLILQHNVPLHVAYRVASWSAAHHFGLRHLGLLAPGKQADIVLLSDARNVTVQQVFVKGEPVDTERLKAEEPTRLAQTVPPYGNTIARLSVCADDFPLHFTPGKRYRVIDVIPNELVTGASDCVCTAEGFDRHDICYIAVLERYGRQSPPACSLLGGFGLREGALAATVSHDSHNIVVIGRSAEEMALAVNQVIDDGGGLCVVRSGQVQCHLPLPIAGLMSTDTADSLAEQIDALKVAGRECGTLPDEPFIQMAFLSLPVIPALKLTSQGLFDGETFTFTSHEIAD